MPQIVITNLFNKTLSLTENYNNVLEGLQSNRLDWMHACGGKGRCTTCRMIVVEGTHNLSEISQSEQRYRDRGLLEANERLTCQTRQSGDIVIKIPADSKFPHLTYSD